MPDRLRTLSDGATMTAVVTTRDRPAQLARLLESVSACAACAEVVVVDDGSASPVEVPLGVRLLRNEAPQGLSAARNRGARAATGDILLFVDDDCVIDASVGSLATAIENDPALAIVGPVILHWSAPGVIWCAGVRRSILTGRTHLVGSGCPVELRSQVPRTSEDFPSVFAVRRSTFIAVGGFDERRFPMHMDEADLAARVRRVGFRVELVPTAGAFHDVAVDAPLAQRLHLRSAERAYATGRDRSRYVRLYPEWPTQRVAWLAYWLGFLAPAYLVATLAAGEGSVRERFRTAFAFARGTVRGLYDIPTPPGQPLA